MYFKFLNCTLCIAIVFPTLTFIYFDTSNYCLILTSTCSWVVLQLITSSLATREYSCGTCKYLRVAVAVLASTCELLLRYLQVLASCCCGTCKYSRVAVVALASALTSLASTRALLASAHAALASVIRVPRNSH